MVKRKKQHLILTISLMSLLIVFFHLRKFSPKIKSKSKELNQKEKAVKDFYMYELYLNPPDINN